MSASTRPDAQAILEERAFTAAGENLENSRADREQRKKFADLVFRLMVGWLIGIGVILLLSGFGAKTWFFLSDKVLISLVAGVSINVIGTFAIVMNYLFRKSGPLGADFPSAPKKVVSRAGTAKENASPPLGAVKTTV